MTLGGTALLAVFRLPRSLIRKVQQTRDITVSAKNHVAAPTSVAAVRPSARNVLFTSKACASVAALAADYFN